MVTISEALPALGIVAAVLGVIKAMGALDQAPEVLGHLIGAALVGTFAGIFFSYAVVSPIATKIKIVREKKMRLYVIVKQTLLAFMNGAMPQIALEHGRKTISAYERPRSTKSSRRRCRAAGAEPSGAQRGGIGNDGDRRSNPVAERAKVIGGALAARAAPSSGCRCCGRRSSERPKPAAEDLRDLGSLPPKLHPAGHPKAARQERCWPASAAQCVIALLDARPVGHARWSSARRARRYSPLSKLCWVVTARSRPKRQSGRSPRSRSGWPACSSGDRQGARRSVRADRSRRRSTLRGQATRWTSSAWHAAEPWCAARSACRRSGRGGRDLRCHSAAAMERCSKALVEGSAKDTARSRTRAGRSRSRKRSTGPASR